jgi:hypothetical protein
MSAEAQYRELIIESIETLERLGCQFEFCNGPTLEPEPMVTCFSCALLARLRVAVGQSPRRDDELTFEEAWRACDAREMARATGRTR